MTDRNDHLHCYQILEISPQATLAEVRNAYLFLKELYSTESIASLPVKDELQESDRNAILLQVEQAYQVLSEVLQKEEKSNECRQEVQASAVAEEASRQEDELYCGAALRRIREAKGISLEQVFRQTRIPMRHLESIESEKFDELLPEVYLRGFLRGYAEFLSLAHRKVVDDYMQRYSLRAKDQEKKKGRRSFFSLR